MTTLMQDEEIAEDDIQSIKDNLGKELEKIEKQGNGQYNLSVKQLKDEYQELHERVDARIREWYVYMVDLADLKADLLTKVLNDIDEERIHTEAASKIEQFWTDRTEEHMTVLTDRLNRVEQQLKDRVEMKVDKEVNEIRQRMTRLETQLEFYRERDQKKTEIIRALASDKTPNSDEVQERAEEVQNLQSSQSLQDVSQDIAGDDGDDDEGEGSDVEVVDDESSIDPIDGSDTGSETSYTIQGQSLIEIKEVFEEMLEEMQENGSEGLGAEALAEKTDVDAEKLRDRYSRVQQSFDSDETPEIPGLETDGE